MKYLRQIRTLLSGKKAYITGVLMVVLGWLQNDNIMLLDGIAVITLRAGIAKK